MSAWRVARSLDQLLREVNAAAPHRSTASDGTVGDLRHQAESFSDHNPNAAGVVRARDITHDPAHGCDAGKLAEAIRQLGIAGHPALGAGAYVIWNRRIASPTIKRPGDVPWDWESYTGSNPHDHHVHVSVSRAAAGYDSERPWGVMRKPKPKPNHVTRARQLLRQAIDELDATPPRRRVVHGVADGLRRLLGVLPPR